MDMSKKTTITAILLFLIISIIYLNMKTTQIFDSKYSILLTEQFIYSKTIDLSPYFNKNSDSDSDSKPEYPYQIEIITSSTCLPKRLG